VIARNKKSVTLDLRGEAGQQVLRELAAGADILIENFRPGSPHTHRPPRPDEPAMRSPACGSGRPTTCLSWRCLSFTFTDSASAFMER
jgi:hypothetical protein